MELCHPTPKKEGSWLAKPLIILILVDSSIKKDFSNQMLSLDSVGYVLKEIHERCYGHHPRGKSLALKALRARYYWPTMILDAKEYVK